MAICMEYIKSGEVLIAPRLDYKYQYLLKCVECEECYCLLEPFIEHCTIHHHRDDYSEESLGQEDADYYTNDAYDSEIEVEEGLSNIKDSITDADEETSTHRSEQEYDLDNNGVQNNDDVHNDIIGLEKLLEEDNDTDWTSYEHDNEQTAQTERMGNSMLVQNFMASSENVAALIDAYEGQTMLWNNKISKTYKRQNDRTICMQKIVANIKKDTGLTVSVKEVAAVIAHLRLLYRIKLERDKANMKYHEAQKNAWLFERLGFLKPCIDSPPIAVLDAHPFDLTTEQILRILDIYKRYPNLWNSEKLESCCKNKRAEALRQILKDIEVELDIDVDESSLKKYIKSVNIQFSRQKRRDMGLYPSSAPRFEYYEHIIFLYDHVGPFKCSVCKKIFMSPLHLKAHKYEHEETFGLHCPQCNKGYKSVDLYIAHGRRHMNDISVECKECGRGFLRMADLRSHMLGHTGAKPFCCDICGMSFRQSQSFKVHKRRHNKEYSHHCTVCQKGCYSKHELNTHMRIHRDIRDFACRICGKAFKTRKTMKQHEFIHEEGRKHICQICGKRYKNKIGLGHHVKTHTRQRAVK